MKEQFFLNHKQYTCALLSIDTDSWAIINMKVIEKSLMPFLGNADAKLLKKWWENRAVPGARTDIRKIVRQADCQNNAEYLVKNLALSLTDGYWISHIDSDISWATINLYSQPEAITNIIPYHNISSYDPNASLGGQLNKYWDVSNHPATLYKTASEHFGQQSINEKFASVLHKYQPSAAPFVLYETIFKEDHSVLSKCDSFTNETTELISAFEVLHSRKTDNSLSLYDNYITICAEKGIDRQVIQDFMDYQTMTDFLISNDDRHLSNFGILRNSDTLELIGPAPIFDSGNSMFFSDPLSAKPYSRADLLSREINSLNKSEELMLTHIKNKSLVDIEALPSEKAIIDFFVSHHLPEEKAHSIAANFTTKKLMLHEFQKGHKISLYFEK